MKSNAFVVLSCVRINIHNEQLWRRVICECLTLHNLCHWQIIHRGTLFYASCDAIATGVNDVQHSAYTQAMTYFLAAEIVYIHI